MRSLSAKGWEPFDGSREMNEPEVRRFLMVQAGGWVSIAGEDGEMLDDWASSLSKSLGVPVLTIFTWDGEAVVLPRCFVGGAEKASFELPRGAERGRDGRARVRCRALEPWLDARTRAKLDGWLVLDDGPDEALGEEEEGYTFVSEDDSLAAIAKVLGLEHAVVDAYDDDLEGSERFEFRPTAKKKRVTPRAWRARPSPRTDRSSGAACRSCHHAKARTARHISTRTASPTMPRADTRSGGSPSRAEAPSSPRPCSRWRCRSSTRSCRASRRGSIAPTR